MSISSRRYMPDISIKQSPAESVQAVIDSTECLSQITGVKVRKACLFSKDASRILWLGYGEGRCLAEWHQSNGIDPYEENTKMELDSNPFDLCILTPEKCAFSNENGDITIVTTKNDKFEVNKTFSGVNGFGDSRKIANFDKTIYSGSSNGSLAIIDIESGRSKKIDSGFAGIRCITPLSGGSLIATGHNSGQLLVWDVRDLTKKPSVVTPSKISLDGVTALDTHPAQANIIAFGTNNGAVGFSDIRGANGSIIPMTYDISSSAITDVKFHPQNADHLLSSSLDGGIIHWDATRVNSFSFSGIGKQSPWLSDKLGDIVSLNTVKNASFSSVNNLDIANDIVLASSDIMSILIYPSMRFSLTSTA